LRYPGVLSGSGEAVFHERGVPFLASFDSPKILTGEPVGERGGEGMIDNRIKSANH